MRQPGASFQLVRQGERILLRQVFLEGLEDRYIWLLPSVAMAATGKDRPAAFGCARRHFSEQPCFPNPWLPCQEEEGRSRLRQMRLEPCQHRPATDQGMNRGGAFQLDTWDRQRHAIVSLPSGRQKRLSLLGR